jgi:hypothetical protein
MRRIALITIATLAAAAAPARAQQGPNDITTLTRYAGTYAVDCTKPGGVRIGVDVKSLVVEGSGKRIATGPPLSAFSYYGRQQPPPGFDTALLGEGKPTGLALLAMKDAKGPYLSVEADPLLHKQFGKAALAGKFRRCP